MFTGYYDFMRFGDLSDDKTVQRRKREFDAHYDKMGRSRGHYRPNPTKGAFGKSRARRMGNKD